MREQVKGGRVDQPTSGDVDVGLVPRHRLSREGFEDEGTNFVRLVVEKQPRVDPGHERVLLLDFCGSNQPTPTSLAPPLSSYSRYKCQT